MPEYERGLQDGHLPKEKMSTGTIVQRKNVNRNFCQKTKCQQEFFSKEKISQERQKRSYWIFLTVHYSLNFVETQLCQSETLSTNTLMNGYFYGM